MPDTLEDLAQRYRRQGYEVTIDPSPEELPPFFSGNSDIVLFAIKGDEYRALHSASDVTSNLSNENSTLTAGREPDSVHLRTLLSEAERFLRTGALEAALMLAWSVTEASLRRASLTRNQEFKPSQSPRDLIRNVATQKLSREEITVLETASRLRSMVAHGLQPAELPSQMIRDLIDIAQKLTPSTSLGVGEGVESGFKSIKYGYGIRQVNDLLSNVRVATRVLGEVLGESSSNVSVEWNRTEDSRGKSIVTLRLADFSGAVTGTLTIDDLRSHSTLRSHLYRLWGDLLEVRNHYQLEQFAVTSAKDGE